MQSINRESVNTKLVPASPKRDNTQHAQEHGRRSNAGARERTVNAASESTLHIRVHAPEDNEKDHQWTPSVPEWGQCKFYGKPLSACASGTLCREQDAYYGQCIREPANLYGQCGGKGWTGNCSSGKCTRTSEYYAQCTPN